MRIVRSILDHSILSIYIHIKPRSFRLPRFRLTLLCFHSLDVFRESNNAPPRDHSILSKQLVQTSIYIYIIPLLFVIGNLPLALCSIHTRYTFTAAIRILFIYFARSIAAVLCMRTYSTYETHIIQCFSCVNLIMS
jgi:hypothetical protein